MAAVSLIEWIERLLEVAPSYRIATSTCGQSYKQFTLVNYNSRVVPDLKTPHITTLESYITIVKCFIILTTGSDYF